MSNKKGTKLLVHIYCTHDSSSEEEPETGTDGLKAYDAYTSICIEEEDPNINMDMDEEPEEYEEESEEEYKEESDEYDGMYECTDDEYEGFAFFQ